MRNKSQFEKDMQLIIDIIDRCLKNQKAYIKKIEDTIEIAIDSNEATRVLKYRIVELKKGINEAMTYLATNYDTDGNRMDDSDAYNCLQKTLEEV